MEPLMVDTGLSPDEHGSTRWAFTAETESVGGTRAAWSQQMRAPLDIVCNGCDEAPWANERPYYRSVWRHIAVAGRMPVRAVSQAANLWSLPCQTGTDLRSPQSRCWIGHFVYNVLCFFKWIADENAGYALLSLESAMDLGWAVHHSACGTGWGFTVPEVLFNYERILTAVWHRHQAIPMHWMPVSGPLSCWRPRATEPQERAVRDETGIARTVQCLVLVVYPSERERMEAIVDTYAPSCDSLVFVTASDAPASFRGYMMVDLRPHFGILPDPDRQQLKNNSFGASNTIQKTLFAFLWAAVMGSDHFPEPDVVCRLDSDTLFLPENLRRILFCRNFSASEYWALGYENYLHKFERPGRTFLNGGTGVCMSHKATKRLFVRAWKGDIRLSFQHEDWKTSWCVAAPGHWDDVVLGSCLHRFEIPISRWGTDCFGRNTFYPERLGVPIFVHGGSTARKLPTGTSFRPSPDVPAFRSWQTVACDPAHWASDFPVSFHPYRDPAQMRQAFAAVRREQRGAGYSPRIWNGRADQCYDLSC